MMVQVPLIVDAESGVNDMLDRDGSRTPIQFHIANDHDQHPIDAQVVQAATKWKRVALRQFGMAAGEGLVHRHAGRPQGLLPRPRPQRLRRPVGLGAGHHARAAEPRLPQGDGPGDLAGPPRRRGGTSRSCSRSSARTATPTCPRRSCSSTPRTCSTAIRTCRASSARRCILQEFPAVFIIGIGWTLADGYPHEMRAADYDDWVTETTSADGRADARAERRHPRLEPGDEAPPRAHLDGHPGRRGDAPPPARAHRPARLARAALPPRRSSPASCR